MIRRLILRPPHSILILAFFVMSLPNTAARAQDRGMQDRLDRLERDLSMLQRQVYRGAPSPVANTGSPGAVDAELRMDRLEAQMRELTGRVEDAVNGVEQLRHRLEQINSDIGLRSAVGQVQGQGQGPPRNSAPSAHASAGITDSSPGGQFATRGPSPTASSARPRPAADPMPPGTLVPPPPERMGGAGMTPPGTPSGTSVRPDATGSEHTEFRDRREFPAP